MIRLFQTTTAVGNDANTDEKTLHQYTLPAGKLATNGDAVRIRTWIQHAANANNKTTLVYFGASTVCVPTGQTYNNVAFVIDAWVFRVNGTTQLGLGSGLQPNIDAAWSTAAGGGLTLSAPAETLSGTVLIKITGQSSVAGTADDVKALATVIDYLPAA